MSTVAAAKITSSESIARTLVACGVDVATCVPGFGATQAFNALANIRAAPTPFSFHEEVAFNVAHGAALVGTRAAFLTKTHGLFKAANAFYDALTSGTTAALVVLVFEDKDGSHSDNIVEVAPFLDAAGVPWARASAEDAPLQIAAAVAASERQGLPHVVVLDAAEADARVAAPADLPTLGAPPAYRRDVASHLLCPVLGAHQHAALLARRRGTPLPPAPRLPRVPDDLPAAWAPVLASYARVFDVFRRIRGSFVAGDAGTSTVFGLPPYDAIDATTCLGGSTALALGARLAGVRDAWAVSGEFSFIGAGHLGLAEAYWRGEPVKLLLIVNDRANATGGQPSPRPVLERTLAPYAANVRWVRSDDAAALEATLREAADSGGPRIVAVDVVSPP